MGRELKRVPLDFNYPLNKVWYGYYLKPSTCHDSYLAGCEECKEFARIKGVPLESHGCPDFEALIKEFNKILEPPTGKGYQLWETTSEGSPVSPVFETLEALCEWCEENATTFASFKATRDEWLQMLRNNFVYHQDGNAIFI